MAMIPIQSKYPDRAGYTVLNTDTNQLEVFSDGKFGPVGAIPYNKTFQIFVGPNGDFETIDEAFNYIEHIKPHRNPNTIYYLRIIFKKGFVFTKPMVLYGEYMPYLQFMQEDIDTPLEATLENYNETFPKAILFFNLSIIDYINLNLHYSGTIRPPTVIDGIQVLNSKIRKVNLKISNVSTALCVTDQSTISYLSSLEATQLYTYGIYSAYGSFVHVNSSANLNFSDIGITYPNTVAAAFGANTGFIKVYANVTCNIDNCVTGLQVLREGQIEIHQSTNINISNCTYGLRNLDYGSFYIHEPIHFGPNVTNKVYPTTFKANQFNANGILYAYNGIEAI